MGVFDFTLEVSADGRRAPDSHISIIKVLNPTIELWVLPGCPVCRAVVDFFKSHDGVRVKTFNGNARTAAPPKPRSGAKSADFPTAQYLWNRERYPVPLPKLHDGAAPETIVRRLRDQFVRRVRSLHEHQKDLLRAFEPRRMDSRNTPAFTVMWEMGSGKTLGATSLLVNRRSRYNMVLCTNSNIQYWVKTLRETPFITREEAAQTTGTGKRGAAGSVLNAGLDNGDVVSQFDASENDVVLWFEVVGYTAFRAEFDSPRALRNYDCVVLDEAQYFRNDTDGMKSAILAIHSAKNVVLLTGTPLVNSAADVVGMLELIDTGKTRPWEREHARTGELPTPEVVQAFLKGHVSWFDPKHHRPNMYAKHYPAVRYDERNVPMTWPQTAEYLIAKRTHFDLGHVTVQLGRANRYNYLTRTICNAPEDDPMSSPKLRAVRELLAARKSRQVVHSSLVDTGITTLRRLCEADPRFATIKMGTITGNTANRERERLRTDYNRGKLDILFISDASRLGMDLLATEDMWLLEPHQNKSTEDQTAARAIRMGSHKGVAKAEVTVHKLCSVFPDRPPTADEVDAIAAYLAKRELLGKRTMDELEDIDLGREMWDKVCAEPRTINETQKEENVRKHADIVPYLDAFREASVRMSKQRGTGLAAGFGGGPAADAADAAAASVASADSVSGAPRPRKRKALPKPPPAPKTRKKTTVPLPAPPGTPTVIAASYP